MPQKMSAVGNTEEEKVNKCIWWFRSYRNRQQTATTAPTHKGTNPWNGPKG